MTLLFVQGSLQYQPTLIYCDNNPTIYIAYNSTFMNDLSITRLIVMLCVKEFKVVSFISCHAIFYSHSIFVDKTICIFNFQTLEFKFGICDLHTPVWEILLIKIYLIIINNYNLLIFFV